jgi:6-phosphogluconolactonase
MNIGSEHACVNVFDCSDDLAESIAKEWLKLSMAGERIHIALSGGSTPKHIFGYIAHSDYATSIDWQNLHFWWGDERCVSPSDEQSNYGEAMRLLFSHVLIPADNLHPIHGELEAEKALIEFKDEMDACLPKQGMPIFDWILLGLGDDGHTASLFPEQTDFDLVKSALIAIQPSSGQARISLSAQTICAAKRRSFIVTGASKAKVVNQVINETKAYSEYPATRIFSQALEGPGGVEWYLDKAAASELK